MKKRKNSIEKYIEDQYDRPGCEHTATEKAWHFLRDDKRLRYGLHEKVRLNTWCRQITNSTNRHHEGLVLCESGFHGSKNILDALVYTPGSIICRVEMGGKILHGEDKLVAERRRVLWCVKGEDLLRKFARMCALDVIHLWDAPNVVVRYLKTGDESIRAAAEDAAWAAAGDWAAARDAAWAAVGAWDAAGAWARKKQERRLLRLVYEQSRMCCR